MFYYSTVAVGMCLILKHGKILETFRIKTTEVFNFLGSLYKCCLCMGFWAGVLLIPFLYNIEGYGIESFLFPFSTAGICWTVDSVLSMIHSITLWIDKDLEK
jgi:hypothetical protein